VSNKEKEEKRRNKNQIPEFHLDFKGDNYFLLDNHLLMDTTDVTHSLAETNNRYKELKRDKKRKRS
jgi:hypothetical protein